jgi:two-component system cell cycle response regulator DivK
MRRILVIDDEETNQKLVSSILRAKGFEVLQAYDGLEGFRIAKEIRPDLVFMDIQMPELDGIETFKMLKSDLSTQRIPVIALTALAMRGDREKLMDMGFDEYISKPLEVANFIFFVQSYFDSI